jgi:hypothetical protein
MSSFNMDVEDQLRAVCVCVCVRARVWVQEQ